MAYGSKQKHGMIDETNWRINSDHTCRVNVNVGPLDSRSS